MKDRFKKRKKTPFSLHVIPDALLSSKGVCGKMSGDLNDGKKGPHHGKGETKLKEIISDSSSSPLVSSPRRASGSPRCQPFHQAEPPFCHGLQRYRSRTKSSLYYSAREMRVDRCPVCAKLATDAAKTLSWGLSNQSERIERKKGYNGKVGIILGGMAPAMRALDFVDGGA